MVIHGAFTGNTGAGYCVSAVGKYLQIEGWVVAAMDAYRQLYPVSQQKHVVCGQQGRNDHSLLFNVLSLPTDLGTSWTMRFGARCFQLCDCHVYNAFDSRLFVFMMMYASLTLITSIGTLHGVHYADASMSHIQCSLVNSFIHSFMHIKICKAGYPSPTRRPSSDLLRFFVMK